MYSASTSRTSAALNTCIARRASSFPDSLECKSIRMTAPLAGSVDHDSATPLPVHQIHCPSYECIKNTAASLCVELAGLPYERTLFVNRTNVAVAMRP